MISVIVIAKNEQDRIEVCLKSIKWADEIIVADNGSEDKTLEIAGKYTDKIIIFKEQDFATLRNKATEKASGDWLLYIDADERVLESLKNEIMDLASKNDKSAYAISRKNIIFGKEVNYGPYQKDWVIRLLKKDKLKKWMGKVHEYPQFEGKLGYTKNSLLHLTHRNIDQVVLKSLNWSKIDARLRYGAGHPQMTGWRFLRILISETFNQGIKRKGFFGGTVGVIDSTLQVFSLFITYVRLWQMQQPKFLDKVYQDIDANLLKNNFTKI